MIDDGVRESRLEIAPTHRSALGEDFLLRQPGAELVHGEKVVRFRSFRVTEFQALKRVRLTPLDLLRDLIRGVQHVDPRSLRRIRLAHLGRPVRQRHDASALLGRKRLRHQQHVTASVTTARRLTLTLLPLLPTV